MLISSNMMHPPNILNFMWNFNLNDKIFSLGIICTYVYIASELKAIGRSESIITIFDKSVKSINLCIQRCDFLYNIK